MNSLRIFGTDENSIHSLPNNSLFLPVYSDDDGDGDGDGNQAGDHDDDEVDQAGEDGGGQGGNEDGEQEQVVNNEDVANGSDYDPYEDFDIEKVSIS